MPGAKARIRLDGADPINRGLVGFWPMGEGGGAIVQDIGPYGLTGYLQGAPSRGVGKLTRSPIFNGSSQYATIANNGKFNKISASGANAITMAGWLYWNASTEAYNSVISKETLGNGWMLSVKSDGTLAVYITGSGAIDASVDGGGITVATNVWTFLVATMDATTLRTFVNAQPSQTAGRSGGFTASTNPLDIGRGYAGARYINGRIGLARVFSRAITRNEIARLYRDPWAGTARRREPIPYRPPISYPFAPEPVGYQYTTGNVALAYTPGTATDTGARGGDDAPASAADLRRLASLRRRQEAEDTERAARLRQSLERAYRAATGAVEDAGPDTMEAAQNALQAVAAVEPNLPVLDIAPLLGTARALEELTRLIQLVQLRRDRMQREDEELAMMLAVL